MKKNFLYFAIFCLLFINKPLIYSQQGAYSSSTFPVLKVTRTSSATGGAFNTLDGVFSGFYLSASTSSNMVDGFGTGLIFGINDNTLTAANYIARIYARRDGSDNVGSLQFYTGTNPSMTIRASGYVGIGTTNPTSSLTVTDNTTQLLLRNETNASGSVAGLKFFSGASWGVQLRTVQNGSWLELTANDGAVKHKWVDKDYYSMGKIYAKYNITTLGRIGIGTESPTEALDVVGNIKTTGNIIAQGKVGIGTTNPTTLLSVEGGTGDYDKSLYVKGGVLFESGYIDFARPSYTTAKARIGMSSYTGPGGLRFVMSATGTGFGPGLAVDALFLAPNGNVGMGTTVPTAKLTVKGEILCSGVTVVTVANIPDYVFNSDYKLRTIKQVESFVTENKHLPGVPSAAEFKEKGMDMVEMSKILLQKIEELTLYMIEQDKTIQSLQSQITELKK